MGDGSKALLTPDELVGKQVLTPEGAQWVIGYSRLRQQYVVSPDRWAIDGRDYNEECLRVASMPSPDDPEAMRAWLADESLMFEFVEPGTVQPMDCSCGCRGCMSGTRHLLKPEMICHCEQKDCPCV